MENVTGTNIPFEYNQIGPFLDLGVHREALETGRLWRAVGVDGRVRDTIRRFPGFRCLTRFPLTGVTPTYFKSVSVQRGDSTEALRGFVVGYRATVGANTVTVVFVYYDTSTSEWSTYTIASGVSTDARIDACVANRNLFVTIQGLANYLVVWDTVSGALATRSYLGAPTFPTLVSVTHGQTIPDAGSSTAAQGYLGTSNQTNEASYRLLIRWYSPRRASWGPASTVQVFSATATYAGAYFLLDKATVLARIQQGYNKLYVYRTITSGGTLYLEQVVSWAEDPTVVGVDNNSVSDTFNGPSYTGGTGFAGYMILVGVGSSVHSPAYSANAAKYATWSLGLTDRALVQQRIYDPFLDGEGDPPVSGLVTKYQEGMVMADLPTSTNALSLSTTLRWSTLFSPSPEMFPVADHFYSPSEPGHSLLSITTAGEYAFAILDNTVLRLHRSGGVMAVNELFRKIGGKGRYGNTTSGNILYLVTDAGLMSIDGTSGRQDIVGVLDRLFVTPELGWNRTLADVHLAFDGGLNALMLLNTARKEIYMVWTGTGAVTSLEDVPFQFVTEGPDPETGGPVRAWYISSSGGIFCADNDRTNSSQTLMGLVNTPAQCTILYRDLETSFDDVIYLKNPLATPGVGNPWIQLPERAIGFRVYFLTGANKGLSRAISARSTYNTQTATGGYSGTAYGLALDQPLPYDCVNGDLVAVAPIVMRVGFHGLRTEQEPAFWNRKSSQSMCVKVNLLGGACTPADNPYLKLHYQIWADNLAQPREQKVTMYEDVTRMWANIPHVGASLLPAVECFDSDVDLELVGVQVHGTILPTGAVNQP